MDLRPYQAQAVEALRENLRAGVKRQVLCAPTGSGKTVVAMEIVQAAAQKGSRVYFVCDLQTLVNQTSERFAEFGIPHGKLMGQASRSLWNDVLVVSSQTLERRGFDWWSPGLFDANRAPDPDLMIVDEAHTVRKKIMDHAVERGITTIGLTATPFTPGMAKYYQEVVNCHTTQQLIGEGFLSPLRVVAAEIEVDVEGLPPTNNGEWARGDVSDRVLRITGDVVPEWKKQTDRFFDGPQQTIVFCPSVADSEEMAEKFQVAGFDFRVVHYKQNAEQKQEIIDAFKRREFMGLISCTALTKGFDAPEASVLIDCYPLRKSFAMHVQKIGRVMRIAEGKEFALLIDHAGNWLGFFDRTHAFFDKGCSELSDESLAGAKRESKEKTAHLKCRACGFVFPPTPQGEEPLMECPACGAARRRPKGKIQQVNGSLDYSEVIDGNRRKLPFSGDWWPEICRIAGRITADDDKARKIAFAKYREIFQEWPRGREFERDGQDPDPAVDQYCAKLYKRWRRKNPAPLRPRENAVDGAIQHIQEAEQLSVFR